jgi:chromosome partitioning protein
MRTIAVANQKGGCGKTTTAINLAAFLAREGRQTLVVDMDPQGHATLGLMPNPEELSSTMYDVFVQHVNGRHIRLPDIVRRVQTHLDVAPADIMLSAVPEKLSGLPGREEVLADILGDVAGAYDYVIVDCPPHVGLLTFNALRACAEAIVPVEPSFFSLHGIGKLLETFEVLARTTGHRVADRALVTLYSGRTQFARAVVEEIHRHLADRHFQTVIRHSVKLAEAASHAMPIATYCSRCAGFEDYKALAAEVLEMEPRTLAEQSTPAAPMATPDGVVFSLAAPGAQRVQLCGDFNNWTLQESDMAPSGGVWRTVMKLAPGRYRYRYVVDGVWQSDPLNQEAEPAPYGGRNSVLVVRPEGQRVGE